MTTAIEMKEQVLRNAAGKNDAELYDVTVYAAKREGNKVLVPARLTEYTSKSRSVEKRNGMMYVGIGFSEETSYFGSEEHLHTLGVIIAGWIVADMGHAVGRFNFEMPLFEEDQRFIRNTLRAASSWHRHFFGTELPTIHAKHELSHNSSGFKAMALNYNRAVLGASGGKESTINDRILIGAGYEVLPITFRNSNENDGGASLEIIWDNDFNASQIYLPTVVPLPNMAFDAQGMMSVIRYGLLAFTAAQHGAGILAVGTEFGCSKIWRAGESGNEFDVHDLSVDEGAYVCGQIENLLEHKGLPVHIVAPTSVLHELGILRALHDDGFDLRDLKSCWMANLLHTNYCGTCLKCQRIKRYVNRLWPNSELDRSMDFPEIGIATGSILSYSVQYHLTDDKPELPWATAIIMDDDGLSLQDHRQGYRIIKFLREHMGFTDTITYDQVKNPLELKLKSVEQVRADIREAIGIDYAKLLADNPVIRHGAPLKLPFEDLFYQVLGDDPEFHAGLPENINWQGCICRFDSIPVWIEDSGEWQVLQITQRVPGSDDYKFLDLPSECYDMQIFKTWLNYSAVREGLESFGVKGSELLT